MNQKILSKKDIKTNISLSAAIGQNIRHLRIEHHLTQQDIAKHLSVSYQQVQKYESGRNRIPLECLIILKNLYQVPFETFFDLNIPINKDNTKEDALYMIRLAHHIKRIKNKKLRLQIEQIIIILSS